jgi:hypothetical protein
MNKISFSPIRILLATSGAALLVLSTAQIAAAEPQSSDSSSAAKNDPAAADGLETKTEAKTPTHPVYVPPRRGQPRARVGGGVRGPGTSLPRIQALVPDHVALTARNQPTFLWHLDSPPPDSASLLFTIIDDEAIDPLISITLENPTEPGLQRIDLSDYSVELEPGREYQWSVALVTDFAHRSRDIVTFGWIERVESADATAALSSSLPQDPGSGAPQGDAAALASAGLWYDAVDVANSAERAALLDQIGLSAAGLR